MADREEGRHKLSKLQLKDAVTLRIMRNKTRDDRLCPSCDKQTFWILGIREVGKDPSERAEEARSQTELCLEGYQLSLPRQSRISIYP